MIGIIYKFTIVALLKHYGHRPFYIGQHWEKKSIEHFLKSKKNNYYGGGTLWNNYLKCLKKMRPNNWRNFIKREVLCVVTNGSQETLDKMEEFYIKKEKSNDIYKQGGCNIIDGTSNKFGSGSPAKFPSVRKKISIKTKERFQKEGSKDYLSYLGKQLIGEKNPNYGHKWTPEMKENMRQMKLGMYKGEKNPNYGKKWSKRKRNELSKKIKIGYQSGKYINPMTNKVRITNGIINTTIPKDAPLPEGFRYGMKPREKK